MEQLEARWLLACASNFDANTATLSITCNGAADVVNVLDDGDGGITGDMNGLAIVGAEGASVRNVVINTGRGHDRLNYELQGSLGTPRNISIITDKGNDQVNLDLCVGPCIGGKGAAPDSINDDLSITIQAGDGNDRVAAQFDEFIGEYGGISGFLSASLGKGIDQLDVDLLGDLVSATVMIIGTGEAGADRMSVDALTDLVRGDGTGIDVSNNSSLSVDLSGGGEIDKIDANYNGIYNGNGGPRAIKQPGNGSLSIQVDGGLDDDVLTANVELDSGSTGSTDLDVDGAAGLDRLQLMVINSAGAEGGPAVDAAVDGGLGRDRAIISNDVVASEATESVNVIPPEV
jgi:hypothetical protein